MTEHFGILKEAQDCEGLKSCLEGANKGSSLKTLGELLQEVASQPPLNFLWRGIKEQTLNFLVAQSKVGKTTLAENLAMSIAAGCQEYLGSPIWTGGNQKVMMIALEEFYVNRTQRNMRQSKNLSSIVGSTEWQSNYMSVDNSVPRYFDNDSHWNWLKEEIMMHSPRLVVIDSLTRLHLGSSIEDSMVCIELTKKLRDLIDQTGTTFLVIHHTNKQQNESLTLFNMAGSRVLAQEADSIIALNKTPQGNRYIKALAYRYAQEDEDVQPFTINSDCWLEGGDPISEWKILREFDNRCSNTNEERILNYIMGHTGGDISILIETSKLMSEFVDTKVMSKPILFRCLNSLIDQRVIQKQEKGKYSLYHG